MTASRLAALLCLATVGCSASYYWRVPEQPPGEEIRTVERASWEHGFLLGTIGNANVDVRQECPGSFATELRVGPTLWTTLATLATLGIYSPMSVQLTCVVPGSEGALLPPLEPLEPSLSTPDPSASHPTATATGGAASDARLDDERWGQGGAGGAP